MCIILILALLMGYISFIIWWTFFLPVLANYKIWRVYLDNSFTSTSHENTSWPNVCRLPDLFYYLLKCSPGRLWIWWRLGVLYFYWKSLAVFSFLGVSCYVISAQLSRSEHFCTFVVVLKLAPSQITTRYLQVTGNG